MDKTLRYEQSGMALLVASFFVLSYDLATSAAGLLPETFALLMAGYLLFGLIKGWLRLEPVLKRLRLVLPLVAAVAAYLSADLAGAVYAPGYALVFQKYKAVGGFGTMALAVLFLGRTRQRLDSLHLALGGAAFVAAVGTVLNYLWSAFYPLFYHLRLSPRADYNMFATALMTGLIAGGCTLIYTCLPIGPGLRVACLFVLVAAVVPAIYLSGSRRTYLLLLPVSVLLVFCYISQDPAYKRGRETTLHRSSAVLLITLVCILGISAGQQLLSQAETHPITGWSGESPGSGGETAAAARYAITDTGGLFSKRAVIYEVAIDEIKSFDTARLLFGQGLGANIALYDRGDPRIARIYPDEAIRTGNLSAHNMFLADLMDGGLVKLIALISLLCAVAWYVLCLFWLDIRRGFIYASALGIAAIGSFVSGRFGLLYDRYFVLLTAMLLMEVTLLRAGPVDDISQPEIVAPRAAHRVAPLGALPCMTYTIELSRRRQADGCGSAMRTGSVPKRSTPRGGEGEAEGPFTTADMRRRLIAQRLQTEQKRKRPEEQPLSPQSTPSQADTEGDRP